MDWRYLVHCALWAVWAALMMTMLVLSVGAVIEALCNVDVFSKEDGDAGDGDEEGQ